MLLTSSLLSSVDGLVHGFTTRHGGLSTPPYDSLNLAWDRGDIERTRSNWNRVREALGLPDCPVAVVHQVHGKAVVLAEQGGDPLVPQADADAVITTRPGELVAVRTADCVPILLAAPNGVAAVHAGWRGTAKGIAAAAVERLVEETGCSRDEIFAAIGPCIGLDAYEVGEEVVSGIGAILPEEVFVRRGTDRPHVDLKAANRAILENAGVSKIEVLPHCSLSDERFFSHRREGTRTGRMAAVIGRRRPC
ncbi:MAG: peptidoglycan editing factor PgeF [Myxococcota bacterium]|nr:peptidoglycan editing factor PgeF [Myxococcota bacterium]